MALKPPLHKFMVNPQPTSEHVRTQENVLGSKYSIHQALVAQQNLFQDQSRVVNTSAVCQPGVDQSRAALDTSLRQGLVEQLEMIVRDRDMTGTATAIRALPFKPGKAITSMGGSDGADKAPN